MKLKQLIKPLVATGILAATFASASALAHGGDFNHHGHGGHGGPGHHGCHPHWHHWHHWHPRPYYRPGRYWRRGHWHPYGPVFWPAPGFRVVIR